mgnify:CR=1 FL=1
MQQFIAALLFFLPAISSVLLQVLSATTSSLLKPIKATATTRPRQCAAKDHLGRNLPKQHLYKIITVIERNAVNDRGASLISKVNGSSEFQFNFNPAWFPIYKDSTRQVEDGLVVRVVDWQRHPEWANAGAMAMVSANFTQQKQQPPRRITADRVNESRISWAGAQPPHRKFGDIWGAADPRITYRAYNQQYYLTWDNCTKNCWPQRVTYLSTCAIPECHPLDPTASWTFHGAVFPFPYTSGAALLFRDDDDDANKENDNAPSHLAFVCNSNTADQIFVAESGDGLHWSIPANKSEQILLQGRPGCWDASGIAAGPQPERLQSSGDYLLIYNIDTGFPYHPNPLGRCAVGWAILDGNDPTHVVARAEEPLLTPTLPWEMCNATGKGPECQVPRVVFATGLRPLSSSSSNGALGLWEDEFYVIYGGADTVVGVAKIKVQFREGGLYTTVDGATG